jgi:hypothetical protein
MKTLSVLLVTAILLTGCSKKNAENVTPAPKTYLVNTITHAPFGWVDQFYYDAKNRVTELHSQSSLRDYKYTYDNNNNLLTVQTYQINNLSSNNLLSTDSYTYNGNTVTVNTLNVPAQISGSYTLTLNAQGLVQNESPDNLQYNYDSMGNLLSDNAPTDSYTYDNKKHPLSMIAAKNLHLMYKAFGTPETFVNNVVTDSDFGNTTYTYNSDGFPINASVGGISPETLTYDYIIK